MGRLAAVDAPKAWPGSFVGLNWQPTFNDGPHASVLSVWPTGMPDVSRAFSRPWIGQRWSPTAKPTDGERKLRGSWKTRPCC